jgi:hypothetical protein
MGDGEVKLTVTEAIQLAGALLSFAYQAGQDLAYAASDASPCCPGETLPLPTTGCDARNAARSTPGRPEIPPDAV